MVKSRVRRHFLTALRELAGGQRYLCPIAAAQLRTNVVRAAATTGTSTPQITRREREVLTMIATGGCNKQIAAKLRLSVKTVEKHRANMMRKLDLRNVANLTRYALRQGLLLVPPGGAVEVPMDAAIERSTGVAARWLPPVDAPAPAPLAACGAVSCGCPHRYFVDRRNSGRQAASIGRRSIDHAVALAS